MGLETETVQSIAAAAGTVGGPHTMVWPMPGQLDALISFATYAEWQAFFLRLSLRPGIPTIVTSKYDRALKLHLLGWIDLDVIKAGEMAALTTLELALKDQYGGKVRDKRGNIKFDGLLRYMVKCDALTDEKLPIQRRCGLGSVVKRLTGEAKPTIANIRNDLAHGYPFDGFPYAGLLEVVRDLIEYAYRDSIERSKGS